MAAPLGDNEGPCKLPTDLWHPIVANLPRSAQRSCLFVSSTLHDVAMPLLFSHISISFGICEQDVPDRVELARNNTLHEHLAKGAHLARFRRDGILQRILTDSKFAAMVRRMTVRVWASATRDELEDIGRWMIVPPEYGIVAEMGWVNSQGTCWML